MKASSGRGTHGGQCNPLGQVVTELCPHPDSKNKGRKWDWTLETGRRLVERDTLSDVVTFSQMTGLTGGALQKGSWGVNTGPHFPPANFLPGSPQLNLKGSQWARSSDDIVLGGQPAVMTENGVEEWIVHLGEQVEGVQLRN